MTEAMKDRPGYRAALAQHEERERAARMAQDATKQRIEGKLQATSGVERERLGMVREQRLIQWIRDGGDEASFNEAWPSIRGDILRDKGAEREQDFRLGQRNHYREVF